MSTISQPTPLARPQNNYRPSTEESGRTPARSVVIPTPQAEATSKALVSAGAPAASHHPHHGIQPPVVEGPRGEPVDVRQARISGKTFDGRVVTYSVIDGHAFVEGDIALGEVSGDVSKGIVFTGRLWPGGVMPYEIVDAKLERKVKAAIRHLEANTPMRFVERTDANAGRYRNYVSFFEGSGCWSYVGMRGGKQKISIAPGCGVGSTVHEIMHAAGVWHEQSREDRDEHVTIQWDNIKTKHRHNFKQHIRDGEDVGEYDYRSLMHYPRTAFSINGKDTITPKDRNARIGQRRGVSRGDIATLEKLYGRTDHAP